MIAIKWSLHMVIVLDCICSIRCKNVVSLVWWCTYWRRWLYYREGFPVWGGVSCVRGQVREEFSSLCVFWVELVAVSWWMRCVECVWDVIFWDVISKGIAFRHRLSHAPLLADLCLSSVFFCPLVQRVSKWVVFLNVIWFVSVWKVPHGFAAW